MTTVKPMSEKAKDLSSGSGDELEQASSQSSAMSICMSDTTPESQGTSSQPGTCLKRKKKSRGCAFERREQTLPRDFMVIDSFQDVTKRLQFDDMSDDSCDEKTESAKKRREKLLAESARTSTAKKSHSASATKPKTPSAPIRNTCILDSPLDHRKSSRKRKIYGVRRSEAQLPRVRPKRSATKKRPARSVLCALQRMFAE